MTDQPDKAVKARQSIAAALVAALLCLPVAAQTITGKVVGIVDGDTLDILDAGKRTIRIRLQGVDSPERRQDFGSRAKQSLSDLVFSKTVIVICSGKEHRGRAIGKFMLDGRDINLEQINRVMAWYYRQYSRELSRDDAKAYELAESRAKAEKRGLWADPSPVEPWNFRRGDRTAKTPIAKPSTSAIAGGIIGNRNSKIYHLSNCPDYSRVSERNRVPFKTEAEAQAGGYRKARNCPR